MSPVYNKFRENDAVVFISERSHLDAPRYYPAPGTIGTVVIAANDGSSLVSFPPGSTSGDDKWWCRNEDLELVEEYEHVYDVADIDELFLI